MFYSKRTFELIEPIASQKDIVSKLSKRHMLVKTV